MSFYNKYKWLVPSVAFCVLLLITRVMYTGNITFVFLIWNLFLAVLLLYFTYRMEISGNKKAVWCYAMLWLLFFPNAMYITTDLFHLHERVDSPLWYDLLLLLSFAFNGILIGFLSLASIEKLLIGYLPHKVVAPVIFIILCMSGYGIYLGRYLRWNSWDIIAAPFALFWDIARHIIHPFRNMEVWLLSLLFGCWMFVLYKYIRKLSRYS